MSDAMERNCDSCVYGPHSQRECFDVVGACSGISKHKFPEEVNLLNNFAEQIREALPKEGGVRCKQVGGTSDQPQYKVTFKEPERFSLDKLIDDHWNYNEGLVKLCFPYGVDGWETDDILRLVEFAYKQSGKHFWKHCKEHYNIEGESNE